MVSSGPISKGTEETKQLLGGCPLDWEGE